jgi:hypothetical protein
MTFSSKTVPARNMLSPAASPAKDNADDFFTFNASTGHGAGHLPGGASFAPLHRL